MKSSIVKYSALTVVLTTISLTSVQAETTNPSEKLQSAMTKFQETLTQSYNDLTEEQQDTVISTRITNMNTAIDAAEKGINTAQSALKYMYYGSTSVKSDVNAELNQFYAQLYRSEKEIDTISSQYSAGSITNDQANTDLTGVITDVQTYITDNKTDYETIMRDVLANQLALAMPAAQSNLDSFNASIALYKDGGSDTTKLEKYASTASTNLSTATTYYNAGLVETNLETQIQDYNNAAKYLTAAQAQIVYGLRYMDRFEK